MAYNGVLKANLGCKLEYTLKCSMETEVNGTWCRKEDEADECREFHSGSSYTIYIPAVSLTDNAIYECHHDGNVISTQSLEVQGEGASWLILLINAKCHLSLNRG